MLNCQANYEIKDQTFFTNDAGKPTIAIRKIDKMQVCLQKINKNEKQYQNQTKSFYFSILKQIFTQKHDNIVNVLDIYEDETQYAYVALEDCSNNLKHYIENNPQGFDNQQIFSFIKQIIKGYQWLIEQGVLHRDLKPENIYYIKNNEDILFKIGGFKYSKLLDDRDQQIDENTKRLSLGYYEAPEQTMFNYSFKADIYSFGLILFEIIKKEKLDTKFLQQKNLEDICNLDNVDHKLKELLCKMIVYKFENRLSWSLLIQQLFYENIQTNKKISPHKKAKSLENGQNCFIKIIEKPIKDKKHYLQNNSKQELQINRILIGINHPNIVKIYEVLHEPECEAIYIIMEDCDGNLKDLLEQKKFDVQDILDFVSQINKGYSFLEEKSIIHRDIKPENILYQKVDNKIQYKITDFGISRITDQAFTKCGTRPYTAPEVQGNQQYPNKCDIYSLGIVLYYLATNKNYPFQENADNKDNKGNTIDYIKQFHTLLEKEKSIEYCYPNNIVLDQAIKSLINKMIVYVAKDRIAWGKELDELIQSIQKQQLSPQKMQSFSQQNYQSPQQQNQLKIFQQQTKVIPPKTNQQVFQQLKKITLPLNNQSPLLFNPKITNDLNQQIPRSLSIQNRLNTPNSNQEQNQFNQFNIQKNQGFQPFFPNKQGNQQIKQFVFNQNQTLQSIPQQNSYQNVKFQTQNPNYTNINFRRDKN